MMRSRTLGFCLAAGVAISLAACGNSGEPEATDAPTVDGTATSEPTEAAPPADDDYPASPITWVVPSSSGGGSDTVTRAMTRYLSEELGTPINVENLGGAGSEIGHTSVFQAEDDGYTLGTLLAPHYAITTIQSDPPYALDDFVWFNAESYAPGVMVVLNDSPYVDFAEAVEAARSGTEVVIGTGSFNDHHLLLLYLEDLLEVDFNIVPYAGGGEGRAALLGGHVDIYFAPATAQAGVADQARGIAVAAAEPVAAWPDATTLREQLDDPTIPGAATVVGYGSSRQFQEQYPERWEAIHEALRRVWDDPEYQAELEELGRSEFSEWRGPEESAQLVQEMLTFIGEHGDLFEGEG